MIWQDDHYLKVVVFPDFSPTWNIFLLLQFVSSIAKSNTDNSYPLTKYGNKMRNVNILQHIS